MTKANSSKPLRFSRRIALRKEEALKGPSTSANRGTATDSGGVVSRPGKQRGTLARTARPAKSSSRSNWKGRRSATKRPLQRREGERASVSITSARLNHCSQRVRAQKFLLGSERWKQSHLHMLPERERPTQWT